MTAKQVRETYGVPAKRGMDIVVDGMPGKIVGFDGMHLRVRVEGIKWLQNAHPTWRVEYPKDA